MVGGETVEALPGEVTISESPRQGWALAEDQGLTVALDLELTPELVRSGLAREAVRLVQNARKDVGLDVGDRIILVWSASGEAAAALRQHGALVAAEVLATRIREGDSVADQRSPTGRCIAGCGGAGRGPSTRLLDRQGERGDPVVVTSVPSVGSRLSRRVSTPVHCSIWTC
jgi:hypothetical protein